VLDNNHERYRYNTGDKVRSGRQRIEFQRGETASDRCHTLAAVDGRHFDIACGQIDIGNAATSRNEDTARGRLQATGSVEAEPRIEVKHVARAFVYMATLPLDANVQFMTVMATKIPYIGRG